MPLRVNCLIFGDDPIHMFTVKTSDEDKNVYDLKDRIKVVVGPRLSHVSALDLELWQVDFALDDGKLTEFAPDGQSMRATRTLDMFNDRREDHVHVIVKLPGMSQWMVFFWISFKTI